MPLVDERGVGLILFGLVCTVLVAGAVVIGVHFLMPKKLVERYWKQPHFGPFQLAVFTGTIWAPLRTVMLLAAIAFPAIARKRGMTEMREVVPAWCRWVAKLLGTIWVITSAGLVLATATLLAHFQASGRIALWPGQDGARVDWDLAIAIAVLLAGAGFLLVRHVISRGARGGRHDSAVTHQSRPGSPPKPSADSRSKVPPGDGERAK
ncbi:hypothetical protein M8A51_05460 [Schlegelella sp. S2-27]|uniref:DUF4328 domain-containing protein n=1 Tax=Caldimonas mangrovi TaxID=2944811 RepID=A0ABT0YLF5_9BURK|nr:hypothetical protein [Caldimonas mangrovi]MCM5678976.1 hypothetical protein [Caldimonas mangrovi]